MNLRELLEDKYYTGKPLETGGTSIGGSAAPALRALVGKVIKRGMKVLDYGAGKYARNADYLRKQGIETFAFDPYNGNVGPAESQSKGWEEGRIASNINLKAKDNEGQKFDVGFTCFVLNVVPKNVEKDIIENVEKLSKNTVHIVRNNDVFEMAKNALQKKDKIVYPFFVKEFNNGKEVDPKEITDDMIREFCKFGVQTSRGFQRIPELEDYGYRLIRKTDGFKVYQK